MRATWRVRAANPWASSVCKPGLRPEAISGRSPNVAETGAAGPMRAVSLAGKAAAFPADRAVMGVSAVGSERPRTARCGESTFVLFSSRSVPTATFLLDIDQAYRPCSLCDNRYLRLDLLVLVIRMPAGHQALIRLGGKPAVGLFVFTLLAFVAETQLSQVRPDLAIISHHVRILNYSAVCASRSGIPTTVPHFVGALLTTLRDITLIPAQLYRSLVFRVIIPPSPLLSLCILSVLLGRALDKRARCRTKTSRPEGSI